MQTEEIAVRRRLGMKVSILLGRQLQEDFGNRLANQYRSGMSQREILDKNSLLESYPNSNVGIALSAIRWYMRGHKGGLEVPPYNGMIPDKERKELETQHRISYGDRLWAEGIGLSTLTKEDRKSYGHLGGTIGGNIALENKVGIHSLSSEDRAKNARLSHESRELPRWKEGEIEYAYQCTIKPEFRRNGDGRVDMKKITLRLNKVYHDGDNFLNSKMLSCALRRYRQVREKKTA